MSDQIIAETSDVEYASLAFYHKISYLRSDTWTRLHRITTRLSERQASGGDTASMAADARAAMHTLEEIEDYTAFPSKDDFRLLWRLLEDLEYNLLNRAVSRISRALSSDVYRNRAINLTRGQIEGEEKEQEQEGLELHLDTTMSQTPPYFELLIVDELTPKEEAVIRSSFRSVQRPEDQFIYDVIVVPSFQDAVAAVLVNPNIQACLLRSGFRFQSKRNLKLFERYLAGMQQIDLENTTSTDLSMILGDIIKSLRPELDLYMVSNMAVETYAARDTGGGAIQDALTHGINAAEWLVGTMTEVAADAAHQRHALDQRDQLVGRNLGNVRYRRRPGQGIVVEDVAVGELIAGKIVAGGIHITTCCQVVCDLGNCRLGCSKFHGFFVGVQQIEFQIVFSSCRNFQTTVSVCVQIQIQLEFRLRGWGGLIHHGF